VDLGGVQIDLVRLPAGEFILGDPDGCADEQPPTRVRVEGFWMGQFEVTNEQFACFDPSHDSRLENGDFLQFSVQERGYPLNGPRQPVCRVSWQQALAFCRWLSEKTGQNFTLPTEAQWEYACRAGTDTPLWYGSVEADFARFANLADYSLRFVDTFGWGLPSGAVPPWRPAIESVNDQYRVSAPVGRFAPNPWGLYDLHGNVSEWTRSVYRSYPYRDDDGRNDLSAKGRRVVRGGSWYDRADLARSACRTSYWPWQRVFDVGFRVVCEAAPPSTVANSSVLQPGVLPR
jgi:formylglycine-generating enzyme required for sulfatase activity